MKQLVISCIFRPHITDHPEGKCWCLGKVMECEHGGMVVEHNFLDVMPDEQERMACFSEQRSLDRR